MDTRRPSARVLVVDDEKLVADSYVMILKLEQYDARAVYSGEEALAILPMFSPDVVLSDIVMGAMSGFDLAIHLAEHHPACRVILVSGHPFHQPDVARTIKHGFEVMTKPVHPAELLARLAIPAESPSNSD